MKTILRVMLASVLIVMPSVLRAATPDVTVVINQFLDAFNTGDAKGLQAAYAKGDIAIVDEFAPHLWTGINAAQEWSVDYEKHAKATGVTDGVLKHKAPVRKVVGEKHAYVILPAVYEYKEKGKAMQEEGKMTLVLVLQDGAWKIKGWTWTGVVPHAAK